MYPPAYLLSVRRPYSALLRSPPSSAVTDSGNILIVPPSGERLRSKARGTRRNFFFFMLDFVIKNFLSFEYLFIFVCFKSSSSSSSPSSSSSSSSSTNWSSSSSPSSPSSSLSSSSSSSSTYWPSSSSPSSSPSSSSP